MHTTTDGRKESKKSTNGRVLQKVKSGTGSFEHYNTKNGKNEFYGR
jgi:hypothetical protein